MNKKGFSFIGFAFVMIIICAIIFLLWPKYEELVNKSKYNAFITNSKDIVSSIDETYINNPSNIYANINECTRLNKEIDKSYSYYLEVNNDGSVRNFKITNGIYKVENLNGETINISEIGNKYEVYKSNDEEYFFINDTYQFETKKK